MDVNTVGWRFLRRRELEQCRAQIGRDNRADFRLLSFCGFFISFFIYVTQLIIVGEAMPLFRSGLMIAYFALLIFLDRCVIREDAPLATAWMYVAQGPVMLLAALLGTVWDRTHQASTILIMMLFLPVFVTDYLFRFTLIQGFWAVLFAGLCLLYKQSPILNADLVHVLEFYVTSCALMFAVSSVRVNALDDERRLRHHLTHDADTDCQNRVALEERAGDYLGHEIRIAVGALNRLSMVNDFYGIHAASAASRLFTRTLMDSFGPEHVYLKSPNDVICVCPDTEEAAFRRKLQQCRKQMHAFEYEGDHIPVTCAFGYVTGAPEDREALAQHIQLAEICLHQAENAGNDQTRGRAFDRMTFLTAAQDVSNTSAQPHDISHLTGLPRLYYFTTHAREMLDSVIDISRRPVIGFIRLSHLREYNDAYGYAQGDALITEIARQLRRAFYSRMLCHVTAGQFCVMCYRDEVEPGFENLLDAMRALEHGDSVEIKAGFAEYSEGEQVNTLIDRARLALKSILPFRVQQLSFYDAALDAELRFRQYLVTHLDEAIAQNWLMVYFQPIVRASTSEVCCEEALSRWNDPEMGLLPPFRFISTLEENGLMYKVNLHVIDSVLENFRQRQRDGVPIVPVSVNLSRRDFNQCDMVQEIIDRVDRSGFPRRMICIEITESAFTADQDLLKREICRFRENGFEVWLDDFGSEYSTLNLLEDIDFDLIKLDMQFMRNFTGEGKNFTIVSHTIAMAREMGMVTLMEGVETQEQFRMIQKLNCDRVQGFLFNRPNPYDYIAERFKTGTGLRFERKE